MGDDEETTDERSVVGTEGEPLSFGQTVFTEDDTPVGTIQGIGEAGIYVATHGTIETMRFDHERTTHQFGEGELMWRCTECGEMGQIKDSLPERCPGCEEPKEVLMYWTED